MSNLNVFLTSYSNGWLALLTGLLQGAFLLGLFWIIKKAASFFKKNNDD